jgi:phosphoribosylaminoimidazolecarboxamide formyltransferase/IMP cyclohydrolase
MRKIKTIKSALISVFHKDGLEPLVKELHKNNVTIYSTGGTEKFIKGLSIPVTAVEDLTSYPSILGGRVKTLHPKVFGVPSTSWSCLEKNLQWKLYFLDAKYSQNNSSIY